MTDELNNFFSRTEAEAIVNDPFRFKAKLKIGSDAFTILTKAESLQDCLHVLTGSAAGAALAGTTWVSGLGTLGTLGVSLGMVATPVGWISAAGIAGGAAVFGLKKLLSTAHNNVVDEVPKYINTPLDLLASNLINLMLPAMLYISNSDEEYHDLEQEIIVNYFVSEWGISRSYIEDKLNELILSGGHFDLQTWSEAIGQISEEKDVSYTDLCEELMAALESVRDADGIVHGAEQEAIQAIKDTLTVESKFLGMSWGSVKKSFSEGVTSITKSTASKWVNKVFDASDRNINESVETLRVERIPTIWLLGKTGAGKSSFIKKLTGYAHVPVGMGFMPCTQTMDEYLFPDDKPLLKLIDTRGLGEASYDCSEDVEFVSKISDLIIVVAKLDEPSQSDVLNVLKGAKRFGVSSSLVVLHTGEFDESEDKVRRALVFNKAQFDATWRGDVIHVRVDLYDDYHIGHSEIEEALASVLPSIAFLIEEEKLGGFEAEKFSKIHPTILRYSGISGAASAMPLIGSVSAVAAQGAMIKAIAEHHDIDWSKQTLFEFFSSLGMGFAITQAASLGGKTLLSTVPIAGSAMSGGLSFATTYGLGRVADYYFFRKKNGLETSKEELQEIYNKMFTRGTSAGV